MTAAAPLRILIVDDEPLAIERLQILCARIDGLLLVGTAQEGAAALRLVDALQPDLLLLDIAMPGMNGIDVARALETRPARPAVIFVTAFDSYALTAFDVAAVDYLMKPVASDRLDRAIARVRTASLTAPSDPTTPPDPWVREFWVPHRAEIVRILAAEIDLIEAERDYMRLHVGKSSYLVHQTISTLEQKLDPGQFIRLHRSTIARRDFIAAFRYDENGAWLAQLQDGRLVRIGRSYLTEARRVAGR